MKSHRHIKQSNADTLFKLPVPIPEPPRMVNVQPFVPDLSIDCDLPPKRSTRTPSQDLSDLNAIIKRQDEKLDRISKQLQMILSLQTKKEPEKRTVGTMTSFQTKSRTDKTQRKLSERLKTKKTSDSGLLTSESESRSDASELRSRSKMKEEFYAKILRNFDHRKSNSRSEQSECLSSPSPPRADKKLPKPSFKAETGEDIINKLAEKYLKNDKTGSKSSRKDVPKKTSLSEGDQHNLGRGKKPSRRAAVTVSDFTEEASIGVVNYLEKYGLLDEE